jgi:hypothetical protein
MLRWRCALCTSSTIKHTQHRKSRHDRQDLSVFVPKDMLKWLISPMDYRWSFLHLVMKHARIGSIVKRIHSSVSQTKATQLNAASSCQIL